MKKLTRIVILILILINISGCSKGEEPKENSEVIIPSTDNNNTIDSIVAKNQIQQVKYDFLDRKIDDTEALKRIKDIKLNTQDIENIEQEYINAESFITSQEIKEDIRIIEKYTKYPQTILRVIVVLHDKYAGLYKNYDDFMEINKVSGSEKQYLDYDSVELMYMYTKDYFEENLDIFTEEVLEVYIEKNIIEEPVYASGMGLKSYSTEQNALADMYLDYLGEIPDHLLYTIEKYEMAKQEEIKELKIREQERLKQIEKEKQKRKSEGVLIGMTQEEVLMSSWGEPKDINKTIYEWGVHEQWVYGNGNYLYFEDGILKVIQN